MWVQIRVLFFSAAISIIEKHPLSILIASAKSVRDVFLPGSLILIPVDPYSNPVWMNFPIWIVCILFLLWGDTGWSNIGDFPCLYFHCYVYRDHSVCPIPASIDGGPRFYTSVAPFIVVLPAYGWVRSFHAGRKVRQKTMLPWSLPSRGPAY